MSNIKIPTFLGIFLVLLMIVGLFVTTQGVDKITSIFSQAEENIPPQGVTIANVTNSSFAVYWTTPTDAEGAVFYGETEELEGGVAVDERAIGQTGEKYQTHLVKVNGLSPLTKYFFKIGQSQPSSQIFEATTGPAVSETSELQTLTGTALSSTGSELAGAIATWQSPGASKIATLTKSDGSYSLPLSQARNSNLASLFAPEAGTPEKIVIISGSSDATINCQVGETATLPSVKLGQTLDCGNQAGAEEETQTDKQASDFGSLLKDPATSPSTTADSVKLNIESGETVSTGLPTFSGKVGAKQIVKIVVHSEDVYSATVIAKPDGSWTWTPPSTLSPGEHTVTMTIVNANGTTQTVTRTFFVSSGESLLPLTSGTPSGTLTLTPTPIITPVPTDDGLLLESGVEDGTFLALTFGVMFTLMSVGAILALN